MLTYRRDVKSQEDLTYSLPHPALRSGWDTEKFSVGALPRKGGIFDHARLRENQRSSNFRARPARRGIFDRPRCYGHFVRSAGLLTYNLLRADHVFRFYPLVELFGGEQTEFNGGLLKILAFLVRLLGDLRGIVIADMRIERRDQHQRTFH
jgi:hypothetical protein